MNKTLLYRILEESRDLIPELLPTLWREAYDKSYDALEPPNLMECRQAFLAIQRVAAKRKFCFFIDGLDEYEGALADGVAFVRALLQNQNVKVIVSSRPIAACHDIFHRHPMLKLEDLNRPDIQTYVDKQIGSSVHMERLLQQYTIEARHLLLDLVEKSAGVFLWVVLACRTLLAGFADGDYIHELQDRIDELPKEIEDLFTHVLARIEDRHRLQAVQLLQIAYCNQMNQGDGASLVALPLAMISEHNLDASKLASFRELGVIEMLKKCEQIECRLRSRCQGLLEVVAIHGDELTCVCASPMLAYGQSHEARIDASVWFVHRTLFDYLSSPSKWMPAELQTSKHRFDPQVAAACHALYMSQLTGKKSPKTALTWAKSALRALMQAPSDMFEQVMGILTRLGRIAMSITDRGSGHGFFREYSADIRANHGSLKSSAFHLIVELGLPHFAQLHWPDYRSYFDEACATPLLLHATTRPILAGMAGYEGDQAKMVGLLLTFGCDHNETVADSSLDGIHLRSTTIWGAWLGRIKPFRYSERTKVMAETNCRIMTAFVEAGADVDLAHDKLGMSLEAWVQQALVKPAPTYTQWPCGADEGYVQLISQLLARVRHGEELRQQA